MPLKKTIENYFDAWNRADAKLAASYFCADAVYIDTALAKEYRGHDIETYISSVINGNF